MIASWHRNIVGGAETYVKAIIPELLKRGHQVGLIHGYKAQTESETVDLPEDGLPSWCLQELGHQTLLSRIEQWRPELIYTQGLESAPLESGLLDRYPSALFAHGYYGTCATGSKCHSWPQHSPCSRRFGRMCLVLHYPRRCGGLNPLTTLRNYRAQSQLNALLGRFTAVLTASRHMHNEMSNNGVSSARLHLVPLAAAGMTPETEPPDERFPTGRILMMSRLVQLKGGQYLLRAIPGAARRLNRPLQVIIAGAGAEETKLRKLACALGISAEFLGWLSKGRRREVIRDCDLLAIPSVWPEPFGLSGVEAACLGVPGVGYAAGGIPEWLIGGVSGELAPANPPTSDGLSDAIIRALSDPGHYHRLCVGAWKMSRQFTMAAHIEKLETVLSMVAQQHHSALPYSPV